MPMNIDPLRDPLLVTTIQEQTIPLTKDNIVKVLQLRNEVANLKLPNGQPKYPFLHLDDEGKPDYWAAIAFLHNMTIAELEQRFFVHMQAAYKEAKATFSRAELDLFKNKNKENTKIIVKAHAAKYGLDESQLVTPEIQDDDVIVETLLYHIRRVEVVVDRTNAQRDPGQPLVDKDRFIPVHLKEFFRMLKIMKDHALDGHPKSIFEEELNRQPTAVKKLELDRKRRGKLEAQVVMLQNLKSVVYTEKRKAEAMPNLPENIKILQSLEPFLPATDSLTASASHLPTPTPSPSGAGVSATGSSGVGASASPSAVPLASISLAPAAASGGASFSAAPSLPLTPSASAGPEPFDNFIQIFLKRTDQVRKMPKFVRFIQEVESYDAYAASGLEFWLAILQTIKNIPSDKYEAVSNLLQEIKQEYLTIQHGFEPSPGNQLREAILTVADYQITNMLESLQTAEEKEDRARAKQSRIEARRREMVNQWQINDLLVDAYKLLYNAELDQDDWRVERFLTTYLKDFLRDKQTGTYKKDDYVQWMEWMIQNPGLGFEESTKPDAIRIQTKPGKHENRYQKVKKAYALLISDLEKRIELMEKKRKALGELPEKIQVELESDRELLATYREQQAILYEQVEGAVRGLVARAKKIKQIEAKATQGQLDLWWLWLAGIAGVVGGCLGIVGIGALIVSLSAGTITALAGTIIATIFFGFIGAGVWINWGAISKIPFVKNILQQVHPTVPVPSPTATGSVSPSSPITPTPSGTPTSSLTPSPAPAALATVSPTPLVSPTPAGTVTPSPVPTPTPLPGSTPAPSRTPTPAHAPAPAARPVPTVLPSIYIPRPAPAFVPRPRTTFEGLKVAALDIEEALFQLAQSRRVYSSGNLIDQIPFIPYGGITSYQRNKR